MAFNRTYNASNVEDRKSFSAIPVGEYDVQIVNSMDEISKSSGKDMIKLEVEITSGSFKGRKLFSYIVDDQYADQKVFEIMRSCGRQVPQQITSASFRGLCGRIKTKQSTYQGELKSEINYWGRPKSGQTPVVPSASQQTPAAVDITDDIPF